MRKTIMVLLIAMLSTGFSYAQSLSQVVVASSGATITGTSNTLSFTAGEAIISTITTGESLEQGFWSGVAQGLVLSVNDFSLETQITVYPNPVVDYLNLYAVDMSGQNLEIRIYDALGRQLYEQKLLKSTEKETLNLSSFSPGIYMLTIVDSDSYKTLSYKIIKQ